MPQKESPKLQAATVLISLAGKVLSGFLRRFAISNRCAVAFRTWVGLAVFLDVADRFASLEWLYSDAGSLPRWAVLPAVEEDRVFHLVCAHCWFGTLEWQQALSCLHMAAAAAFAAGMHPPLTGFVAWLLHISFSLRNPSLIYILDRYLHLLVLYAICLPHTQLRFAFGRRPQQQVRQQSGEAAGDFVCSAASIAIGLQLVVIYLDAGLGKLLDPAGSWMPSAAVPALETYLRHTPTALLLRHALDQHGMRLAGAAAAFAEAFAAPILIASDSRVVRRLCIAIGFGLHIGIALCLRNTGLLSLAAVALWVPFWDSPPPAAPLLATPSASIHGDTDDADGLRDCRRPSMRVSLGGLRGAFLAAFGVSTVLYQWHGGGGPGCGGRAGPGVVSALLLHNRWNVFTSAEGYVVWEIAPARLVNGSVVDIWRGEVDVAWTVPSRPASLHNGRWRAWPYTAERAPLAESAFWGALCREWDTRVAGRATAWANLTSPQAAHPGAVVGFHFYMMQAHIVPGGGYSNLRKRLVRSVSCEHEWDAWRSALA